MEEELMKNNLDILNYFNEKEDHIRREDQKALDKASNEAYEKKVEDFEREYKTLYTAKVHSWLPDGSWLKDGHTLLVIQNKAGIKARYGMFGDDIDLEGEIKNLADYIDDLKASLCHLKDANRFVSHHFNHQ